MQNNKVVPIEDKKEEGKGNTLQPDKQSNENELEKSNAKSQKAIPKPKAADPNSFNEKCKGRVKAFLEHWTITTFMFMVTVFALFGDDVRTVATNGSGDTIFYDITTYAMQAFCCEITLSVYGLGDYFNSFFFWLDVLSTATLVFDIGWMKDAVLGTGGGIGLANSGQLARAAKSAKAGLRAARIIRIVRLIRLLRIVKLFKASQASNPEAEKKKKLEREKKQKDKLEKMEQAEIARMRAKGIAVKVKNSQDDLYCDDSNPADAPKPDDDEQKDPYQETNVGKILNNRTTKRVILFVQSIMMCIPVYAPTTYKKLYSSYGSGVANMYFWIKNETISSYTTTDCCSAPFNASWNEFTSVHEETRIELVYLKLGVANSTDVENIYKEWGSNDDQAKLRAGEKKIITSSSSVGYDQWYIMAFFSKKADSDFNGYCSILRTIFTSGLIAMISGFFAEDAAQQVLAPIESMLEKVKRISINPQSASKIEEDDAMQLEALKKMDKALQKKRLEFDGFETSILEKTIVRIGALLSLGFGDAGSKIISRNMQKSGEVDAQVAGVKTIALFSYFKISDFAKINEALQDETMHYVNNIGEVIHARTDFFRGAANKNTGDAYLIVWKYKDELLVTNNGVLTLTSDKSVVQTNELALLSIVKSLADIRKAKTLQSYKDDKKLVALTDKDHWDVKVQVSVHLGWAIEGAIGSEFKIDASYIGSNITMTQKIEQMCKYYGVNLLFCGSVVEYISDSFKNKLRMVDRVVLNGMKEPIHLFTIDLKTSELDEMPEDKDYVSIDKCVGLDKKQFKINSRCRREIFFDKLEKGKRNILDCWERDKDICAMTKPFTVDFYNVWNIGVASYISGNWDKALEQFKKTENFIEGHVDQPSSFLVKFINENINTEVYKQWAGFREWSADLV